MNRRLSNTMLGLLPPLLLVLISCVVIWRAGDAFMVGSNFLGRGLSAGVRGASINAIASSLPELFTAFFFLFYLEGADGFAGGIGTTTGSAIFNSMIIPSASVLSVIWMKLAREVKISRKAMLRDGLSLIVVIAIFLGLLANGSLAWQHGLLLVLIYFLYLIYIFSTMAQMAIAPQKHTATELSLEIRQEGRLMSRLKAALTVDLTALILRNRKLNTKLSVFMLIASSVLMAAMCYLLVQACQWAGSDTYHLPVLGTLEGLNIPVIFVALILAATASSIPDTIISVKDARDGKYDDALSNALGSNIFAICLALGLPLTVFTAINGPITFSPAEAEQIIELVFLLLVLTCVAVLIFTTTHSLATGRSFLLVICYGSFFTYILGKSTENPLALEISAVILSFLEIAGVL